MVVAQHLELPGLQVAGEPVMPGQYVFRNTVRDIAGTDKFEAEVIIADIADPLNIQPDDEGMPAISVISGVVKKAEGLYHTTPPERPPRLPTFVYEKQLRIPNLILEATEIDAAVEQLMDAKFYEEAGDQWSVTIIGLTLLRPFIRRLFVATEITELDKPEVYKELTLPQKRALAAGYVTNRAMDDFLAMPPTEGS